MNPVIQWIDTQLKDFSKRISAVFVKKDDLDKFTPMSAGIYKISTDEYGRVSSATPVTKQDFLDFGIVTEYEFSLDENGDLYCEPKQQAEGG